MKKFLPAALAPVFLCGALLLCCGSTYPVSVPLFEGFLWMANAGWSPARILAQFVASLDKLIPVAIYVWIVSEAWVLVIPGFLALLVGVVLLVSVVPALRTKKGGR